jgi:hypothetical protein
MNVLSDAADVASVKAWENAPQRVFDHVNCKDTKVYLANVVVLYGLPVPSSKRELQVQMFCFCQAHFAWTPLKVCLDFKVSLQKHGILH